MEHYRWLEFQKNEKSYRELQATAKLDRHFVTEKFKPDHSEQKRLVKSVALNLIVDCDLPINIVQRPGFIRHHEVTNKMYNSIDRYGMKDISLV